MPIIAKDPGTTDFEPAPEGFHPAICVDVVDLGNVETSWGTTHQVQIRWQLDGHSDAGLRNDGKQWLVSRKYKLSLHDKAELRKALVAWRGKQFTPEELNGFDVEKVVGSACMIQVLHGKSRDGQRTFANVQTITPLPKGMEKPVASDYVRVKDRDTATTPTGGQPQGWDGPEEPVEEPDW